MAEPGRNYPFVRNDILPSFWANAIQRFVANAAFNFRLTKLNDTTLRVPLGATADENPVIGIQGRWRWSNLVDVDRAHPSGAAGLYEVFAVAADNDVTSDPDPFTDDTNYAFDLRIVAGGGTPSIVAGTLDIFRKVGQVRWDGSKITQVIQLVDSASMEAARDIRSAGSSIIATDEARSNVTYGTMTTPDTVAGVELVRPGLLAIAYRALWKESVSGAARAAVFINGAQLQLYRALASSGSQNQALAQAGYINGAGATDTFWLLQTMPWGLVSYGASGGVSGGVLPADTVPVALGLATYGGFPGFQWEENNASQYGMQITAGANVALAGGGQVLVPMPAGVYDVDVRFKSASGSVHAKQRKLLVEGRPF